MENTKYGKLLFKKSMRRPKLILLLGAITFISGGLFLLWVTYYSYSDLDYYRIRNNIILGSAMIIFCVLYLIKIFQINDLEMYENGFYHTTTPLKFLFKQKKFFIPYNEIKKIVVYNEEKPNWIDIYTKSDKFYYIPSGGLESKPTTTQSIEEDISAIINIFQKYTKVEFEIGKSERTMAWKTAFEIIKRLRTKGGDTDGPDPKP